MGRYRVKTDIYLHVFYVSSLLNCYKDLTDLLL